MNIGGVLLMRDERPVPAGASNLLILTEGYRHLRRPGRARPGGHGPGVSGSARRRLPALPHPQRRVPRRAAAWPRASRSSSRRAAMRSTSTPPPSARTSRANSFPARRWCVALYRTPASGRRDRHRDVRRSTASAPPAGARPPRLSAPRLHAIAHGLRRRGDCRGASAPPGDSRPAHDRAPEVPRHFTARFEEIG